MPWSSWPAERPVELWFTSEEDGSRAANQSLTQEQSFGSYRKQPNYVTVILELAFFQPPQHELTGFNDYVIMENFTTNMKIPSGGHIGDWDVH